MVRVLVLPGSIRSGSWNAALAGVAARELTLQGHSVTRLSLADYELPIYNGDLEAERGIPAAALQLTRQFEAHEAILIVSPEYNAGVPPLLKNAIDWVSRPKAGGYKAFGEDRVFALASASPSQFGGARALLALRQSLAVGLRALVIGEQFTLPRANAAFEDKGGLADSEQLAQLRRVLEAMTRRAAVLRRELD